MPYLVLAGYMEDSDGPSTNVIFSQKHNAMKMVETLKVSHQWFKVLY